MKSVHTLEQQAALATLAAAMPNGVKAAKVAAMMAEAFLSGMAASALLTKAPEAGQKTENTATL